MKKILLGSVATGAIVAAGSASAADLGRPVYKGPPPMVAPPVPAFSWTGCFVGAHGGWGWGKKDVTEVGRSNITNPSGTLTRGIDTSGAIFGGQIGCDYQFAGNWVLGIQGDFAGARLTGDVSGFPQRPHSSTTVFQGASSVGEVLHVRTDWLASITARIGFTGWLPRTLFYVRGGGAWIRENWQAVISGEDFNTASIFSGSQTRTGWTVGGGLEYAIAPNWSVFAEFNHYDFGNKRLLSIGGSHGGFIHLDAKQRIEAVRLGVNYRFNLFGKAPAPVVARY